MEIRKKMKFKSFKIKFKKKDVLTIRKKNNLKILTIFSEIKNNKLDSKI